VTSYAVTVALVLLTFIVTIVCRKRGIFYPPQHADTIMNMLYFLVSRQKHSPRSKDTNLFALSGGYLRLPPGRRWKRHPTP